MAVTIRKPVPPVAAKPTGKVAVKPATKAVDGFQVVSIDSIEFLPSGRGGGKPMDPAVAKLVEKALSLQEGQGFKIPQSMRTQREITSASGATSILYTYKGAPSVSKHAAANEMTFKTRRDTQQNLWLFRVAYKPRNVSVPLTEEGAEE